MNLYCHPCAKPIFMVVIVVTIAIMLYIVIAQRSIRYSWRSRNFMIDNQVNEGFGTKRPHEGGANSTNQNEVIAVQHIGPGTAQLKPLESIPMEFGSLAEQSAEPTNIVSSFSTLLSSVFPTKKNLGFVSNKNENQIWWHYPSFQVGSYAQITNNLKYMNNPDIATCTPSLMCGTYYDKRAQPEQNYIYPLPAVNIQSPNQTRVNYFTASRY